MSENGDQAFRADSNQEKWSEMTYGGVLSFLRRKYSRNLKGVDVVVSGLPYDSATTNRPGTRFGPRAIREASTQLAELKSFPFGFEITNSLNVVDWGDCMLDPHRPDSIVASIQGHAEKILDGGCKMLTFGGDHFISYPLLKAYAKKYGPISLLQVDAHCDTWEDDGVRLDHGTMFTRAIKEGLIDVNSSTQVGLRTFNDNDFGFEILSSPWIHTNGIGKCLEIIKKRAGENPLYVSFDVDGLDPAFAPGTGTPVSGGLASWQALEIVRGLANCNLVGLDVVEVSPPYDHSDITAIFAATIAHDWLCLLAKKNGAQESIIGRI
ncbi:MAG: agmatinase [Pseudomonadota bacterium]|nr:agmatinase [Pseudomonadota bacterium]